VRCAAITRAGERCKLDATSGSYCWSHDSANAEERRKRARRGGKAKGAGELSEIKRDVRDVISGVLDGSVDKAKGAVALQGFNILLRAAEIGQRVDLEELAREVEELKRGYGRTA
jgi:hypothetical protein